MRSEEELGRIHERSLRNEVAVKASRQCGCFYCFAFFSPAEIDDWWDKEVGTGPDLPLTATCPRCGIDSVLPESDEYELNLELIRELGRYAFNGYARGERRYCNKLPKLRLDRAARIRQRLARYLRWKSRREVNKRLQSRIHRQCGCSDCKTPESESGSAS